jgi:hypothetical protein
MPEPEDGGLLPVRTRAIIWTGNGRYQPARESDGESRRCVLHASGHYMSPQAVGERRQSYQVLVNDTAVGDFTTRRPDLRKGCSYLTNIALNQGMVTVRSDRLEDGREHSRARIARLTLNRRTNHGRRRRSWRPGETGRGGAAKPSRHSCNRANRTATARSPSPNSSTAHPRALDGPYAQGIGQRANPFTP